MAQLLDQFYVNSPNFPPLIREKKDAVRDVNLDLLPTKKQQKRKFNFQYTAPNDLFDEVVKDSRGSLISNDVLKKHVNVFYQKKFNNNLNWFNCNKKLKSLEKSQMKWKMKLKD